MTLQESLQQQIATATALIATWNGLLLADATSTDGAQTDYSLDGESYQREAWRAALLDRIERARRGILETQMMINQLYPYWVATKQVMR